MEIYAKNTLISTFFCFLASNHDFIIYIDFTRYIASNTATDYVKIRSHRIFNTNL